MDIVGAKVGKLTTLFVTNFKLHLHILQYLRICLVLLFTNILFDIMLFNTYIRCR